MYDVYFTYDCLVSLYIKKLESALYLYMYIQVGVIEALCMFQKIHTHPKEGHWKFLGGGGVGLKKPTF